LKAHKDVRVTIRVDKDLKERAESLFEFLGMNMTTALNVFLRKAVEEAAIPFEVSAKNTGFGAGLSSGELTHAFEGAVHNELEENQRRGLVTARYDAAKKQAYLESADGTQEQVR